MFAQNRFVFYRRGVSFLRGFGGIGFVFLFLRRVGPDNGKDSLRKVKESVSVTSLESPLFPTFSLPLLLFLIQIILLPPPSHDKDKKVEVLFGEDLRHENETD